MNRTLGTVVAALVLLTLASQSHADEPAWSRIQVKEMHCAGCAKRIAAHIYAIEGVREVRVDVAKKTLFVAPHPRVTLSPRALWEAIEKGNDLPVRIVGPSGTFLDKPTS